MEDRAHLYDLLDSLEECVLTTEKSDGATALTAIHRLFQAAHNLKSGLAMVGFENASKVFHQLEDGLDSVRRGKSTWSRAWADAVLNAVDIVRPCLNAETDLAHEILAQQAPPCLDPACYDDPIPALSNSSNATEGIYRIDKLLSPGLSRQDFESLMVLEDIASIGQLIAVEPPFEEYALLDQQTVVSFSFHSPKTSHELESFIFDPLIVMKEASAQSSVAILVAEDDPAAGLALKTVLSTLGDCVLVSDGEAAVREWKRAFFLKKPFQIVLLDLMMPNLNGHEALHEIRIFEESQGILGLDCCRVFFNSANHDYENVMTGFRYQADGYFFKPFALPDIRLKIQTVINELQKS